MNQSFDGVYGNALSAEVQYDSVSREREREWIKLKAKIFLYTFKQQRRRPLELATHNKICAISSYVFTTIQNHDLLL